MNLSGNSQIEGCFFGLIGDRMDMKKIKSAFMLIELLVVLAIIMFIVFKVLNLYFMKPSLNKETQKVISEQGIDTVSSKSLIDSTRNKLRNIQNRHNDELNQIK